MTSFKFLNPAMLEAINSWSFQGNAQIIFHFLLVCGRQVELSFELGFCDLQRILYILYSFLTKEKTCEKPQRREGSWSIQEIQRMSVD